MGAVGRGEYKEMVLDPERGWSSILQNSDFILGGDEHLSIFIIAEWVAFSDLHFRKSFLIAVWRVDLGEYEEENMTKNQEASWSN